MREFAKNGRVTPLKLSSQLSSSDRQALHDLAELLGLDHKSEGESLDQRHLVISKRNGELISCVIPDAQYRLVHVKCPEQFSRPTFAPFMGDRP